MFLNIFSISILASCNFISNVSFRSERSWIWSWASFSSFLVTDNLVISSSEDEDTTSDEESSSGDDLSDEIKTIKKDVDNIKHRKHKLSLKCMSDVTPKVYNERFRGWGFTYWGN